MKSSDTRIDAYIEKSADFAKPILSHLRQLIHQVFPEIVETTKWGFPHFDYKGPICSIAAFKKHCAFTFWKGALLSDPYKILDKDRSESMGQFGRISSLDDLPDDETLASYILEAIVLNEQGIKLSKKPQVPMPIKTPDYFQQILNEHPQVKTNFEQLSNSHKKEYINWFEDAKTESTRLKRVNTALEWLAEGKSRNWKYERKQ